MLNFADQEHAREWMADHLKNEEYVDNERFAHFDNEAEMELYRYQQDHGCCGFFDQEIIVNGRRATIGCNYGH